MKNTMACLEAMRSIAIIAFVAVIGFTMAGCDDGTGPGTDPGTNPNPVFSVSGKFDKGGGNNVAFSLADASSYSRSARAVTSETYAVKGELVDDDFTIRLSGTYDPTDRTYTASASANSIGIRYTISGAYDSSGNSAGSTATVAVKDQGTQEWTITSYIIDETASVTITGTAVDSDTTGGIPAFGRGNWNVDHKTTWGQITKGKILFNQWNIISVLNVYFEDAEDRGNVVNSLTSTVISVDDKGGGTYDVIVSYPIYTPTNEDQVVDAIKAFLTEKGLTSQCLDGEEGSYDGKSDFCYDVIWLSSGGYYIQWYKITEWSVVAQFYGSNYVDRYLMNQGEEPWGTAYEKYQLRFNSNNTELLWLQYMDINANVWYNLAGAQEADYIEEGKGEDYIITFTR